MGQNSTEHETAKAVFTRLLIIKECEQQYVNKYDK